MESPKTAKSQYFLLIDTKEKYFTKFSLLSLSESVCEVYGPIEVITEIFYTKDRFSYFENILKELEKKSGQSIFSHGLILILDSNTRGIKDLSITGSDKILDHLEILKNFKVYSGSQNFNLLLDILSKNRKEEVINLVSFDWPDVYYGVTENGISKIKATDYKLKDFINKIFAYEQGLNRIGKWLPFNTEIKELENYLANKMLYSRTIPLTFRDLIIEQAILRELISENFGKNFHPHTHKVRNIVVTGDLKRNFSSPEQTVLTLIDSLRPGGISHFYFEKNNLMRTFSSLFSKLDSQTQANLLKQNFKFEYTVFNLIGNINYNANIGKITIKQDVGDKQEILLQGGEIYFIPGHKEIHLTFELEPQCGLFPEHLKDHQKKKINIFHIKTFIGQKGLIIDCRGPELFQKLDLEKDLGRISRWYRKMNIYKHIQEIK